MAKILLIYPNRWGRGITPIWVASHSASLKKGGHKVELFDTTFFSQWSVNETDYNTENKQYKPSDYNRVIKYNNLDPVKELNSRIMEFRPDAIFSSALSSHIHGEGEYVNIEYYNLLLSKITVPDEVKIVAGGLQVTAGGEEIFKKFDNIQYFIRGESEIVLRELAARIDEGEDFNRTYGLLYKKNGEVIECPRQELISEMDKIGFYDYSLFSDQSFLRPYNGEILRAVDYEMSRGCLYACSYCVETVIQKYYGFQENSRGTIKNHKKYLRNKSSSTICSEICSLNSDLNIKLLRCQDTNFLTIERSVLEDVAEYFDKSDLDIILYIETRPEGINRKTVELLKRLKVDGVGMGIELSNEHFRESNLNRYSSINNIEAAFSLLKEAGIKRTAYNVIGFPDETEENIQETIEFNRILNPDNITVAFYSPYQGTEQQIKSYEKGYFQNREKDVDGQLRTLSEHSLVNSMTLEFYKKYFSTLTREGLDRIEEYKHEFDLQK